MRWSVVSLLIIGLAGCASASGTGNRLFPSALMPSNRLSQAATTRKTSLNFVVLWNKRDAAQSVSIAVNDLNRRQTILERAAGTSSVTLHVPVGYDAFYLRLWSGPRGTGKLLRSAAVARNVVANDPRPTNVELSGKCAQIAFGPAADQPLVENVVSTTGANGGFKLVGPQAETFLATPEDDRGTILLNRNGPDVTLGVTGAHLFKVKNDGAINNAFTLKPADRMPVRTVAEMLTPRSVSCLHGSNSYPIFLDAAVYVEDTGYDNYSQTVSVVQVFDGSGNYLNSIGFFDLHLQPQRGSLAYDPDNQHLYLANVEGPYYHSTAVIVFDLNGKRVSAPGGFPGLTTPLSVVVDTVDKTVFVGNQRDGQPSNQHNVKAFDESGNAKMITGTFPYMTEPYAITWNKGLDRLYVRDGQCGQKWPDIVEFNSDGLYHATGGNFPNSCSGNYDRGMVFDPLTVRLLALEDNSVEAFDNDGNPLSLPPNSFQGLNDPLGIAIDGAVSYITNCRGFVKKYDAGGADITPAGAFSGLNCPTGIAVAP